MIPSLLLAMLVSSIPGDAVPPGFQPCAGLPARPDTSGFAASVAAFRALPAEAVAQRAKEARRLADRWCAPPTRPGTPAAAKTLRGSLAASSVAAYAERTRGELKPAAVDVLGGAIADLEEAARLDPTEARVHVALGLLLRMVGEPGAAIDADCRALSLIPRAVPPDEAGAAAREELLSMAILDLATSARETGRWEVLAAALEAGRGLPRSDEGSGPLDVLRGLWLAGSGQTTAAIDYAVRMPAVRYRRVSSTSSGRYPRPGAFANDWIRSQALLADGDAAGARQLLGEYGRLRFQRLPQGEPFWEDAGLLCELVGDPEAARWYRQAQSVAPMSFVRPVETITTLPQVLGFPDDGVPHFTHAGGGFAGGSPFGYIAVQSSLAAESPDAATSARARDRALEMCDSLLRRGIRPDVVRAFRGRLHLAMGCREAAYEDLAFAHRAFRDGGAVDPGTSRLLGLLESARGDHVEARALLDEAVSAMPDNALNWRQLGVTLAQARQFDEASAALHRGLEMDPASLEGWYNLGVVEWKRGNTEAALANLERAWSLAPGDERVQHMLQVVAMSRRHRPATGAADGGDAGDPGFAR